MVRDLLNYCKLDTYAMAVINLTTSGGGVDWGFKIQYKLINQTNNLYYTITKIYE